MPSRPKKQPEKEQLSADPSEQSTGGRAFWSGTISFGLVTIPVELFAATRTTRGSLRMLAPSGTPVSRRYFTEDGKPVDNASLERGYELDKGEFVVVTDEELEKLAPEQSRDIDLSRFVDRDAIPPLFFERAYILAPTGQSNAAYRLLAATLERTGKAGIASFVMRGKQYTVAIVGRDGLLRAETMRFADELRTPETVGLPKGEASSAAKLKAMRALIAKDKTRSVPDSELSDTYWKRVEALVEKKRKKGEDVVTPEGEQPEENLAEVIDLVAILKRSLGEKGAAQEPAKAKPKAASKKPAAKKAATKKVAAKKTVKKAASARGK